MRLAFAIASFAVFFALARAGDAPRAPASGPEPNITRPPAPEAKRPRVNDRCYTPMVNCILMDPQKMGSSCWCVTPFGPSYGHVR